MKRFIITLSLLLIFMAGCSDSISLPDNNSLEIISNTMYKLSTLEGTLLDIISIDTDNDGVVDGFDLDGNSETLEITIAGSRLPAAADINGDGETDCYFLIGADKSISVYSSEECEGEVCSISVNDSNKIQGMDTTGNGENDVLNIVLEEVSYSLLSYSDSSTSSCSFTGIDSDSDSIIDRIKKTTSPALQFTVLDEHKDGVFSIDINNDRSTDFYLTIGSSGNVTTSTASDGTGDNTYLVITDGVFRGVDTDGDKLADIRVSEVNITINLPENTEPELSVENGTSFTKGNTFTCRASLEGTSLWRWYLNGERDLSAEGSSITIDTGELRSGIHNLTAVAVTESGSYSKQISFTVAN